MHEVSFKVRTSRGGNQFKVEQTFEKVPMKINLKCIWKRTKREESKAQNSSKPISAFFFFFKLSGISFWCALNNAKCNGCKSFCREQRHQIDLYTESERERGSNNKSMTLFIHENDQRDWGLWRLHLFSRYQVNLDEFGRAISIWRKHSIDTVKQLAAEQEEIHRWKWSG